MKKSILNLGKALKKAEQREISGGYGGGSGGYGGGGGTTEVCCLYNNFGTTCGVTRAFAEFYVNANPSTSYFICD
jgi:hypothetical protein